MVRSLRIFCLVFLLCALPFAAQAVPNPQSGQEIDRATWVPTIEVIKINNYMLAFYDGRDIAGDPPFGKTYENWIYWGAMNLGLCTYVIHQGDTALIYDTMTVPEQAVWIRDYLEKMGIKKFLVVLSHSHNDHIAGNEVFKNAGADIIASKKTREKMIEVKDSVEGGNYRNVPDAPAIKPVILPNILFDENLEVYVGDIQVEILRYNIHSQDGNLIYLPKDKILLSGDTLEDPITYISNPGDIADHVAEMKRLYKLDFIKIYPNHGSPEKIKNGGFNKTLIDSTINYISKLVKHSKDKDFIEKNFDLKAFIPEDFERGWIFYFPAYQETHESNLKKVQEYYKDKKLPKL